MVILQNKQLQMSKEHILLLKKKGKKYGKRDPLWGSREEVKVDLVASTVRPGLPTALARPPPAAAPATVPAWFQPLLRPLPHNRHCHGHGQAQLRGRCSFSKAPADKRRGEVAVATADGAGIPISFWLGAPPSPLSPLPLVAPGWEGPRRGDSQCAAHSTAPRGGAGGQSLPPVGKGPPIKGAVPLPPSEVTTGGEGA